MKRKLNLLIIVTSLAFLGILITQGYWVKRAIDLKKDLFYNHVNVALNTVSNKMFDHQLVASSQYISSPCNGHLLSEKPIEEILDPAILDSLIRCAFSGLDIGRSYAYAVYSSQDSVFVMGKYADYRTGILNSPHQINLTCLYRPDVYMLSMYIPNTSGLVLKNAAFWMILSAAFSIMVIAGYFYLLSNLLRQKKLSLIKSDFINNITHEFKTPLSTINITGEMLEKQDIISSPEKVGRYARIILDENNRLREQVDHILQLSVLDHEAMNINKKEVSVHSVIRQLLPGFRMYVRDKKGDIRTHLDARPDRVMADKNHFSGILSNIIDNAIKYSPEKPEILISTSNVNGWIEICIRDNGIGIRKENQKQVFKKMYRVPTGDLHDVKGFGIGLHYAKTMTEAHGGKIKLESEPGKGSTFRVYMPVA